MTEIPGVPSQAQVVPGMAHFAGTGPAGKHCDSCAFYGYWRKRAERWDDRLQQFTRRTYCYGGCEKFWKLTGSHGPAVSKSNKACKYYINKEQK